MDYKQIIDEQIEHLQNLNNQLMINATENAFQIRENVSVIGRLIKEQRIHAHIEKKEPQNNEAQSVVDIKELGKQVRSLLSKQSL